MAAPKSLHSSIASYVAGFVLSVCLTLAAYALVTTGAQSHQVLTALVIGLAVVQLIVQLLFFLHLGQESRPRWNVVMFLFMLMVLVIVVFGSLWIMNNLDYHSMSPAQTDSYIREDEGIQ